MQNHFFLNHAILFLLLAAATPAQAITFATGAGADNASCGAVTAPCRTLQQAVTNTPAGGYVVLQGPADFGPTEIHKSISISGENGATIRATSTGSGRSAVLIYNDRAAVVRLRGLTIEGVAGSINGIELVEGARLEVADCVTRNFALHGIYPSAANSLFAITNATVENSGWYGVRAVASGGFLNGYVDGLRLDNNRGGLSVEYASPAPRVVVRNSIATRSHVFLDAGFSVGGNGDSLMVLRDSTSSDNATGVFASGGEIWLRRSTITSNVTAVRNNEGGVRSFGDNVVRGNADDTLAKLFPATPH